MADGLGWVGWIIGLVRRGQSQDFMREVQSVQVRCGRKKGRGGSDSLLLERPALAASGPSFGTAPSGLASCVRLHRVAEHRAPTEE
jgi:hypothetical protein